MNSKRVVSVSVNLDSLPSKEKLIELAIKTKEYATKRDALKLIKKEITKSGLYRSSKRKSKSTTKASEPTNSGTDNNKQSKPSKAS